MTDFDANRLVMMLTYNFAGFMPQEIKGAAIKKSIWIDELLKYDAQRAEQAVKTMIRTMHYPPQIVDFREHIGVVDKSQAMIGGPVYGTEEGNAAMYTADPEHVEIVMAQLMRDLA